MIKKITCFLALGMSLCASAGETLNFDAIKLNELAKVTYTQILSLDFVADNDFNNDGQLVTMYIKDKSKIEIKTHLTQLIENAGYLVNEKKGIIYISKDLHKIVDFELETFFYKPKYREVNYLTEQLSNIFKVGAFTFKRQIQSQHSDIDKPVNSSPSSAQSLITQPLDSFIFYGTKNEVLALQKLLPLIDTPDSQVQITAYLYEVTNTDNKATSFNLAASLLSGVFDVSLAGQVLANSISFKSNNISAGLSALASDSRFKVVSSPNLLVKNRQKGSFNVGAEVPILGKVSYQNNGQPVQSVEYKPSGVILDLTPVFYDNKIELTIHHQISNFVVTNTGVNSSPTLIKRELNTVVNSAFDDVILLGGLSETKATDTKSGLPFLPDFLRSNSSDFSKSDILLLLHVTKI